MRTEAVGGDLMETAGSTATAKQAEETLKDGTLLSRYVEGDQSAFAELMKTYSTPIYSYLSRCGVPTVERDDLFQEIFCKVHCGAPSFDSNKPLRPWLYTIAVNTVRNHLKRVSREKVVPFPAHTEVHAPATESPLVSLEGREVAQWLEDQLDELPEPQREILLLCRVEQLSQKEVAEILGLPVNTVKTHLHRARLHIARALVRYKAQQQREASR